MKLFLIVIALLCCSIVARAACTGSSPNLSAPDTGNVTTNGSNLQACLNAAALGDTITVDANITYLGNFSFPDKGAGTSFITVQSSAVATLTAGVRVLPARLTSMAKLTTSTSTAVMTFVADSHHWKFIGLAVTTAAIYPNSTRTPFLISNSDTGITYNHWPHDLTFDRMLIYAGEQDPLPYRSSEEAIVIDGANITVSNCNIYNFMGWEYPSVIQTVTGATNANPVQVTFSASIGSDPGHKFLVYLDGATGSWTPLNGPKVKVATWVDSTHATLQSYNETTFALTNIDSTGFGTFSGQSINRMSQNIATSRGMLIQNGPGPYTITNNTIEAYYTPIFTGGSTITWVDPQNDTTVTNVGSLTQLTFAGVGTLQVGDLFSVSALQDQAISGATAGSPTSLTVPTMTYPAGTNLYGEGCVTVSGFTGSWAPLNGAWGGNGNGCGTGSVTVIDSTHISIPIDSSGFGAVTSSSPKWVATIKPVSSGPNQWSVGRVTNIAGNIVTFTWWGHQPGNVGGNGLGILAANGARVLHNGLVVSSISATRNTLRNKRDWIRLIRDVADTCDNCSGQPPKASWEAKMGNNITISGNRFTLEGGDLSPRSSTVSMALNQANQNGATPWISLNNWAITSNIFDNYTYIILSMKEEYESGLASSGFTFSNNLMTPASGSWLNIQGSDSVTLSHNTVRNFGTGGGSGGGYNAFTAISGTNTNSIVRDNIGNWVFYGYDDFSGVWAPTRDHNYLIDSASVGSGSGFPPAGDTYVANVAGMGFTDVASADAGGDYHGYRLTAGSVGHNTASDGTDVGTGFAALDAALGAAGAGGLRGVVVIRGSVVWH